MSAHRFAVLACVLALSLVAGARAQQSITLEPRLGLPPASFTSINAIAWAGDSVIFQQEPEEWNRWYAVAVRGGTPRPIELTPGDGQVEYTSIAKDGRTLFYSTNAGDIDRRHVWRVPTSGGRAEQVTMGDGIETYPAALASGARVAVLSADALRPFGVGVWPSGAGQAMSAQKVIYPRQWRKMFIAAELYWFLPRSSLGPIPASSR